MPHYCPPPRPYCDKPYPKKVKRNRHIVSDEDENSKCDSKCDTDICSDEEETDIRKPHQHSFPFPFQQHQSEAIKEKREKDAYYRLKDEEYKKREEALARREREFEFNPPAEDTFSCISDRPLLLLHDTEKCHDQEYHDQEYHHETEDCDADTLESDVCTVLSDNSHRQTETYIIRIPKKKTPTTETTIIKINRNKNI